MCVCLCGWEKKARWRRCTAIWRHFLTNSLHSSFGFVCLKDCLEALSLWRGPWLLSPQWRMRERGSACSLLSVRVDDGRFAKGPSGVWGVFSHRKRIGEKNFPLTAHPQRTRDVLLDGSLGKNIPSHCLKQRDVRARLAYYRNSFPFRLLSLPSCQSCLRKTGGGGRTWDINLHVFIHKAPQANWEDEHRTISKASEAEQSQCVIGGKDMKY